jgi:hypothetical protein
MCKRLIEIATLFLKLGITAFDGPAAVIALISIALLILFKINSTWLVVGGAIIGLLSAVLRYCSLALVFYGLTNPIKEFLGALLYDIFRNY